MKYLLIILLLTLLGCGSLPDSTPIPRGEVVSAPEGWKDFCKRHPEDEQC